MRSIIFGENVQTKSPFRTISWNVLSARVKSTLITNVDVLKNYFPPPNILVEKNPSETSNLSTCFSVHLYRLSMKYNGLGRWATFKSNYRFFTRDNGRGFIL